MRTTQDILDAQPQLHRDGKGGFTSWTLPKEVLFYIDRMVDDTSVTLETGAGVCTLLFALKGAEHTAIAHHPDEIENVRRYCMTHGISLERVDLINNRSEFALPNLPKIPLDFVLIDGRHAFPSPFVDWYFTVDRLKIGGIMLVDDTNLKTGQILKEFMSVDHRFELVKEFDNTVAFKKLETDITLFEFDRQPWMLVRNAD